MSTELSEQLRRRELPETLIGEIEKLSKEHRETLAWSLLDDAGIVVVLGLWAQDHLERRRDFSMPEATIAEIKEAMTAVSEQDWTNEFQTAKELVDEEIEKLIANRSEA